MTVTSGKLQDFCNYSIKDVFLLNFLLRTVIHEKFINALITFRVIGKDRVTLKLVSDVSGHRPGERGDVVEVGPG